jgi:hypothetical protein
MRVAVVLLSLLISGCATTPPPAWREKLAKQDQYLATQSCTHCATVQIARDEGHIGALNSVYISIDDTELAFVNVSEVATLTIEAGKREVCLQPGPKSLTFPECKEMIFEEGTSSKIRVSFDAAANLHFKRLKPGASN